MQRRDLYQIFGGGRPTRGWWHALMDLVEGRLHVWRIEDHEHAERKQRKQRSHPRRGGSRSFWQPPAQRPVGLYALSASLTLAATTSGNACCLTGQPRMTSPATTRTTNCRSRPFRTSTGERSWKRPARACCARWSARTTPAAPPPHGGTAADDDGSGT